MGNVHFYILHISLENATKGKIQNIEKHIIVKQLTIVVRLHLQINTPVSIATFA